MKEIAGVLSGHSSSAGATPRRRRGCDCVHIAAVGAQAWPGPATCLGSPPVWAGGLGLEPGLSELGSARSPFTAPPKRPTAVLESFAESRIFWLGCRLCFISCRPSNGNKTRLCHLKVLKIKPKPATSHPLWAAQDLGVDWGRGRGRVPSRTGPGKACP